MARLLADIMGYDLLPAEAFAIGEEARDAHREYKGKPRKGKPADQRLKDAASTAKSKAKAAAAKDEELAAGLGQRLEDIDAVLATDRRELARTVPSLSWPARDTVIHEPRQPRAEEAEQTAGCKLRQLRKAVTVAEEALASVDCVRAAAKRELERASAAHAKVCEQMIAVSRRQVWDPLEIPQAEHDAEWQGWERTREHAAASVQAARGRSHEAEEGYLTAEEAAEDARRAVEAEEGARAAERRQAEAAAEADKSAAEWAAEAEAAGAAAAEAMAAEAAARAHRGDGGAHCGARARGAR